ncbi:MAG: lipoate--protein ligase family protein [Kosmotoga sp.]|nr:MAG: lipoate--protein ligase family protein [Kosmotoga sp.]
MKKIKWRLLQDNIKEPAKHFAAEEALLRGVDKGITPPTLRIRKYYPSVWLGIYQDIDEDINLTYCNKNNIPIIRRHNPGGTVYQDEGSFCFSAFFKKKNFFKYLNIKDPEKLYELFGEIIVNTLKNFNVDAEISPVNDVVVKDKKIYGSAQIDFYSAFVHSGTFLFNVDIEEMQKVLSPSNLKFVDKGFINVEDRVINLKELVNKNVKKEDVIQKFIQIFSNFFEIDLTNNPFNNDEIKLIKKLYEEKYSNKEWTFKKFPDSSIKVSRKSKSGVINLNVKLDKSNNIIKNVFLTGDFLAPSSSSLLNFYKILKNTPLNRVNKKIKKLNFSNDFKNTLIKLFEKIKKEGNNNE